MKTLHWTSNGYTYLKSEQGQYAFKGVGEEALAAIANELEAQAKRKIRQAALITAYLNGETESNPEALTTR